MLTLDIDCQAFTSLVMETVPMAVALVNDDLTYSMATPTWLARCIVEDKHLKSLSLIGEETKYSDIWRGLIGSIRDQKRVTKIIYKQPRESSSARQLVLSKWIDTQGRKRGYIALIRTLGDDLKVSSDLLESKALLGATLEKVREGIVACDAEGNLKHFNEAAREFHGLGLEAIPQELWAVYYDLYEEDGSTLLSLDRIPLIRALRGEVVEAQVVHIRPKNSPPRVVTCKARQLVDDEGRKLGAVVAIRDTTKEKAAEEGAKIAESRFLGAFNAATHGMAIVSTEGKWLEVNDSLCNSLGYSREELLKTDFQTITHPDDLAADLDLVRQVLEGEIENYQLEKRYFRKDGQIITMFLAVSLVRDEYGNPVHFVSQLEDLTEQRRAEESLRRAQRLDSLGRLTGGIAHDFNNLLSVMLGNLQLLERQLQNDELAARRLERILSSVQSGAALTNRLLSFGRQQTLEVKAISVSDFLGQFRSLVARTIDPTIELKIYEPEKDYCVLSDKVQLESALLNLVINARDAMPHGGHLEVRARRRHIETQQAELIGDIQSGDYIEFSVCDTGIGMPQEVIDQAFEPFYTTKRDGGGSGLGLSIVYGFVKQLGGDVRIHSRSGGGTTVRVLLPSAPRSDGAQPHAEYPDKDIYKVPNQQHKERILIVEDNNSVLEIACELIEGLGYQTLAAETAEQAEMLFAGRDDIDLVFSDTILPNGRNGYELTAKFKDLCPDIPIVLTTGYASRDALTGQTDHIVNLLPKPYTQEDLARAFTQALGGK